MDSCRLDRTYALEGTGYRILLPSEETSLKEWRGKKKRRGRAVSVVKTLEMVVYY